MNRLDVIEKIKSASDEELEAYMDATFERKRVLYPQWDIIYLAVEKKAWDAQKWKKITDILNGKE